MGNLVTLEGEWPGSNDARRKREGPPKKKKKEERKKDKNKKKEKKRKRKGGGKKERKEKTAHLQQLISSRPTCDSHTQTICQKCLQLPSQTLRPLQRRRPVGRNQIQRLQRLLVQIRRLALNHLYRHNPQRPNVDLRTVFFLFDDFGGHPVWCASQRDALGFWVGKLGGEPRVA